MVSFKNPFSTIKSSYLLVFDDSKSIEVRKLEARNVIEVIVREVFFEKKGVNEMFNASNNYILKGKVPARTPYNHGFNDQLRFLCDKGYIEESLKSEYAFIYDEAGKHSSAHRIFKKGEKRFLHIIKIYLNEILESLLSRFDESKDYLIPMHVIAQDDPEFYKRIMGRIESFWNIKIHEKGFWKYQTVISYISACFFAFSVPFVTVIITSIGIYITHRFVFDKKIKILRYLAFGIILFSGLVSTGYSSYMYTKDLDIIGEFDSDPYGSGNGFLRIRLFKDILFDSGKNKIELKTLKKGESTDISVLHYFRNKGKINIDFPKASLRVLRKKGGIIIIGDLTSSTANKIIDSVYVVNIEKPYHIQFLSGIKASNQVSVDGLKCKGYYYAKIIEEEFYIEEYGTNWVNRKGIVIDDVLDTFNEGWCDSGYIESIFRITKL